MQTDSAIVLGLWMGSLKFEWQADGRVDHP